MNQPRFSTPSKMGKMGSSTLEPINEKKNMRKTLNPTNWKPNLNSEASSDDEQAGPFQVRRQSTKTSKVLNKPTIDFSDNFLANLNDI